MYKWITENTKVTRQEYEKTFGFSELLRQELDFLGCSSEEIKAKIDKFENKQKGIEVKNEITHALERFTLLANSGGLHDLILAKKMQVKKTGKGWTFKDIYFELLSDVYPNNRDVLTSPLRKQYSFSDAIILLLYYSSDRVTPVLTLAQIEDEKGNIGIHAFVIIDGYVYDFGKNLIMKQEDYYKLYHVNPIRTYTKEEYQSLQKEGQKLIEALNVEEEQIAVHDIYPSELLCWPEKILEGLRKKYLLYTENQGRK